MHRFEYVTPHSVAEALALLAQYGESARLIAGGTDLLTALKERWEQPLVVVDLRCVPGLDAIEFDPDLGLRIGARVTVRAVETSPVVRRHYPALAYAAWTLASVQIRNLATVAGNVCRASPSADTPPILIALDGSAVIAGPGGERIVPLDQFFLGPGRTVLARQELLTHLVLPPPKAGRGAAYLKHSPRRAMDLAVVGVAARVDVEQGVCRDARLVLGAVAATPRRARAAEAALVGTALTPEDIARAAASAATECSPISDVRGTASYRREMVQVLARRALEQATAEAAGAVAEVAR